MDIEQNLMKLLTNINDVFTLSFPLPPSLLLHTHAQHIHHLLFNQIRNMTIYELHDYHMPYTPTYLLTLKDFVQSSLRACVGCLLFNVQVQSQQSLQSL